MKKIGKRKLDLNRETVRTLKATELEAVAGGQIPSDRCSTISSYFIFCSNKSLFVVGC